MWQQFYPGTGRDFFSTGMSISVVVLRLFSPLMRRKLRAHLLCAEGAMSFVSRLFPASARSFFALRWLNITLRSLHLVGMAGMAGGYLYSGSLNPLYDFWQLTLLSGVAMVTLALWSDGRWLLQLRGAVILFKLLLLSLLPWLDSRIEYGAAWGFVVIILLSSLIAHAPGRVRYRFVFHLKGVRAL